MESPRNSSGIFSKIQYIATQWRSQKFTEQIWRNTRNFHKKNHVYVDVQRHFLWNTRQWRRMCGKCSTRIFVCKRFGKGQWSFVGPGSEKKWYSISEDSPQREWENIVERMLVGFAENRCPIFRALYRCPEVTSKVKVMANCRCIVAPIWKRLRLIFRTITSVHHLNFAGTIAKICEEYEFFHGGILHSCQTWSRHCFVMIVFAKIFLCNHGERIEQFKLISNLSMTLTFAQASKIPISVIMQW